MTAQRTQTARTRARSRLSRHQRAGGAARRRRAHVAPDKPTRSQLPGWACAGCRCRRSCRSRPVARLLRTGAR
eukprot:2454139-Prymnesium_polylepis.1